ncbi:MAG: SdrD B-like domain-containing protein, partial [Bacteroidota bacterium]
PLLHGQPGPTFDEGRAYFRFRLTSDTTILNAPSPLGYAQNGEVEDYFVPVFTIGNLVWEDRNNNGRQDPEEIDLGIEGVRVVLRFGGVDRFTGECDSVNQNTILDPTTPSTSTVNGDIIDDYVITTFTDENGLWSFTGQIEGVYQIISIDTFDLTPSRDDHIEFVTEEDLDSDGIALKKPWEYLPGEIRQAKTQSFKLHRDSIGTDEEGILDQKNPDLLDPNSLAQYPDSQVEQRIDFGYTAFDFGDLDTSYITIETGDSIGWNLAGLFPTDSVKVGNPLEGPKHIVTPDVYLGGCSDAETNAQPDADAGQEVFPAADGMGDNPNASTWNSNDRYNPAGCGDDENGIEFITPLVPGAEAIISVSYQTTINDDGPDAYLQAYFDWNGDGDFYVDPTNPALGIDPNEQIIFTFKNDDTLTLEPNTNAVELELSDQLNANPVILKFNVPADAVYQDGNFLGRFRIGKTPNMGPSGILPGNANFPDGIVPVGEVEDYFLNLVRTSSGNIVWEDRDYDGIQDVDEPVIPGVTVTLDYAGIDSIFGNDPFERTYTVVTDSGGAFIFPGLIGFELPAVPGSKYYRLTLDDPEDMTPTVNRDTFPFDSLSNCVVYNSDGNDDNIDDLITQGFFRIDDPQALCTGELDPLGKNDIGNDTIGVGNVWPDNQIDESIDFGYVGFDYGDLPDSTLGAVNVGSVVDSFNYRTSRDWLPSANNNMGPRHAVQPKLYLGDGVDAELNAQPVLDAGVKIGGDDADSSAFRKGLGADDESGIRLLTPLIPDEFAYIRVDYTSQDTLLAGGYVDTAAFFNAFIDWNGDGDFYIDPNNPLAGYDPQEQVLFTHQGAAINGIADITDTTNPELAGGEDLFTILAFRVPDTSITDYKNGTAFMRFRLSFEG